MTDENKEVISVVKDLFAELKNDISNVKEELKNDISNVKEELKNDINKLEDRIAKIEDRVIKIETTQENVTNKNIQLLAEGFENNIKKLERLENVPEKIENMQSDIDIIKKVVTSHSVEINKLAKAK
jgi:chromosome segregation ATPase